MADFGFVGAAYQAPSIYQDTQECINWYPEVDAAKNQGTKALGVAGDRGVIALYPCPGLLALAQLPRAAEVRGVRPIPNGALLAVCGDILYSVSSSYVATQVGVLNSVVGRVSITDNGTAAYIVDGNNRYSYDWGTGAFSAVGDGPFTGGTICDVVDNFIIYNRPGTRQWGCTNASSTVSAALNLGEKVAAPDNIVALIADHRDALLIGETTTEPWQDSGGFPFPFTAIPGTVMQHGCAAAFSVARLGEAVAWLSKDSRGQAVVIHVVGYAQPVRISTHAVETDIAGGVISDAIAYTYQQGGHEFYMLTFPTQDKTWCFDLATGLWHKRASRDDNNVLHRHRSNCCAVFNGKIVVGDYQNGMLYELSLTTFTDNGKTLPCVRRAPHITTDLKRQFFHELQIQFQPGVGLVSGQGSDPQAMLRWSDDGGSTWSGEHWASIGMAGNYRNRARWTRLGESRDRVFEVTVTDPVYRVIVSANLVASVGA